jgi:hypothetical protein
LLQPLLRVRVQHRKRSYPLITYKIRSSKMAALERQDARAVRALVALGEHEAVDVLNEALLLSRLKDNFKAAVVEALAVLSEVC